MFTSKLKVLTASLTLMLITATPVLASTEAITPTVSKIDTIPKVAQRFITNTINTTTRILCGNIAIETTLLERLLLKTNYTTGAWQPKADLNFKKSNLVATSCNGKIYTVGGYGLGEGVFGDLDTVEEYDPITDKWVTKQSMPTPRYDITLVTVDNKIYAIGGHTYGGKPLTTVEEYNPTTDKWVTRAPMPTPREDLEADVIDGKIYVIGGATSGKPYLTTNEVYNPATNTWETKAPMPTGRNAHDVLAVNGKLHVLGGQEKSGFSSKHEVYDPATNTWVTKQPLPTPRRHLGLAKIDAQIYAIGGYNKQADLATVELYDTLTDTWQSAPSLQTPRSRFGITTLYRDIYTIGGWSDKTWFLNKTEAYKL